VPYVIDAGSGLEYNLTIPFPPGTQYEICMFDTNGATGGCQAIYTVYPSALTTIPTTTTGCGNFSLPSQTLGVQGVVDNGPVSQYGWIDQCTDISLIPKNGTPPFTMLVAPALHPPYKITSNDMSPINWTISLSWGSPFFISLTDANGLSWTNGPLHSGGGGPTNCLSLSSDLTPGKSGVAVPVVVGSSIGALVIGAIIGVIITGFFARNRYNKVRRNSSTDSMDNGPYMNTQDRFKRTEGAPHSPTAPGPDMGHNYLVEPFLPEGHPTSPNRNTMPPVSNSAYSNPQSQTDGSGTGVQPAPHVYVVHHDGGGAPVTVFTGGGGVTELPPTYVGRTEEMPPAGGSDPTDRRPRPGPTPRKGQT